MTAQLVEKPTAVAPRVGKLGDPCVMVIFGAAGDLTARMLIPALYNLARADLLSKEFAVLGVARAQMSDEDFRERILKDVKQYCGDCVEDALWDTFSRRFYYFAGDFKDDKLFPKVKINWRRSTAITPRIRIFSITWRRLQTTSVLSWRSWPPMGYWIRATDTGAESLLKNRSVTIWNRRRF